MLERCYNARTDPFPPPGDASSIVIGAEVGAEFGVFLAPYTFGLSIPIGAAIGGIGGHFAYDRGAKEFVREGWTGITNNK